MTHHRTAELYRCLLVAALSCSLGSCGESFEDRYATLADARARGALQGGWVPGFLPDTAVRIQEAHDVDTNETWGMFEFADQGRQWIQGRLVELDSEELAGRVVRAPERLDWWPASLRGTLYGGRLKETGLSFYESSADARFIVGVDWTMRRAFYWRPPS